MTQQKTKPPTLDELIHQLLYRKDGDLADLKLTIGVKLMQRRVARLLAVKEMAALMGLTGEQVAVIEAGYGESKDIIAYWSYLRR